MTPAQQDKYEEFLARLDVIYAEAREICFSKSDKANKLLADYDKFSLALQSWAAKELQEEYVVVQWGWHGRGMALSLPVWSILIPGKPRDYYGAGRETRPLLELAGSAGHMSAFFAVTDREIALDLAAALNLGRITRKQGLTVSHG